MGKARSVFANRRERGREREVVEFKRCVSGLFFSREKNVSLNLVFIFVILKVELVIIYDGKRVFEISTRVKILNTHTADRES